MENKVSRTAYYTLGARYADAARPRPICGDSFAGVFFDEEAARVWEEFKTQRDANDSNVARHRIIDELVQEELSRNPKTRVLVIGAGFDTRAFRLEGGRWVEVDEPAIIHVKDRKLPAGQAKNELVRIPIEFARESLESKLKSFASGDRVVVIVEGVFMYLALEQRKTLVETLRKLFPRHVLICDLIRRSFFEKFSRPLHERIVRMGTSFAALEERPEDFFVREGYRAREPVSILMAAKKWGGLRAPAFVLRFLGIMRRGYEIHVFET